MLKKTLLSLAVASSVGLTGCFDDASVGKSADPEYKIDNPELNKTWPQFNPLTGTLPLPNDLIFKSDNAATTDISEADGSFSVADSAPPVTTALNQLSGASTVAPPVVKFNGKIDPDSVDSRAFVFADPEDPTSLVPNPGQNVFLLELEYASGDPVLGLSAGEPPTIPLALTAQVAGGAAPADLSGRGAAEAGQYLGSLALSPDYVAEVVELDGDSAIRINPTKPLNPFKRYLVVVTNEVLDINGDPIAQDPLYRDLADPERALGSKSLLPVRQIVDTFWEKTATAFFAVPNQSRTAVGLPALTEDSIALSYSFTTSKDESVLSYILEPTRYLAETITGQARLAGVRQALAGGVTDFQSLVAAANAGVATFESETGPISAVAAQVKGGIELAGLSFPTPADRSDSVSFGAGQDVTQVSALASQFVEFGQVSAIQGTITLPYFLGVPTTRGGSDAEGSVINTSRWEANAGIATAGSAALGLTAALAQSNPTVSDIVNYRFPFPEKMADVDVPMLVLIPSGYNPATDPTVIFQHGITTDRSAALTFGSALANTSGAAVVAIDHPLHGVAPFTAEEQEELATSLLQAGQDGGLPEEFAPSEQNVQAVIGGQLAVGFLTQTLISFGQEPEAAAAAAPGAVDAIAGGASSATVLGVADPAQAAQLNAAIRSLRSFENTVANAGSTVPGLPKTDNERHFDYTANAASMPTAMTDTTGSSGSLFINLQNFTNSRDKNRQSVLDLVNVRMSLGGIDLDEDGTSDLNGSEVYFVGHSLGTLIGIPFVSIVNESSTTADDIVASTMLTPGGGIVRLLENSPSFSPRILGGLAASGLTQGTASLETFLNVNQAALDSVDPVNFTDNLVASGSKVLLQQVNGDQVIPNDPLANPLGAAFDAYLSGTAPLARLMGSTPVTGNGVPVSLDDSAITRYVEGTHGTPVLPQADDAETLALRARVFAEMVGQTVTLTSTSGTAVVPNASGDTAPVSDIMQQE